MSLIKIFLVIFFFFTSAITAQTSSKAIKVVKYKSTWKAYRSGVEIPRSHFFRVLNDQEKMKHSLSYEKDFMNRRLKFSCYMCGNSSLGLMSLAADNQKMVKYTLYGYLISNLLKRIIKQKEVPLTFQKAFDMAKSYNDTVLGKGKIAI